MQPLAYPVPYQRLAELWQTFIVDGRLSPDDAASLDPAVWGSWQRCTFHLDPLARPRPNKVQASALASLQRTHDSLISIAMPFMEDIHQFVEGSDCAILLADGAACVLAAVGDRPALAAVEEAGLGGGAYWSEGQLGTNAMALVLHNTMPNQVVGSEHYFKAMHPFVSSAAPVHNVRGRIVGVLAVLGPAANASSHTLALIMSAARAIGSQLQADWFLSEANRHLTEVNTILGAVSEGVIAWDEAGTIQHVNARAGRILGLNPTSILGRLVVEVVAWPALLKKIIEARGMVTHSEANLRVGGRTIPCMVSLRPLPSGAEHSAGYVATLQPIEQVRRLVGQQFGFQAQLTLGDLYGRSTPMRQVIRQAHIAARGAAPALIRGEGGVGKNALTRAIHNESPRSEGPFVAIDCRAIPRELMVSEFLGHEKDARTDGRPSKFELADGGTLLFDQIENLSLEMQAALLQVLETGHVMRLGSSRPISVDLRVVATTTADLASLVAEGSFLSHLYYRFGVFDILLPPLRERVEDIPLLVERFLERLAQRSGRTFKVDETALDIMCRYPWPGNVREMESVLERALHMSQDGLIRATSLPQVVRSGRVLTRASPLPEPVLSMDEVEREAIIRAGRACQGRVTEMARQLGIGRTTLWRKMKRLNLSSSSFR